MILFNKIKDANKKLNREFGVEFKSLREKEYKNILLQYLKEKNEPYKDSIKLLCARSVMQFNRAFLEMNNKEKIYEIFYNSFDNSAYVTEYKKSDIRQFSGDEL